MGGIAELLHGANEGVCEISSTTSAVSACCFFSGRAYVVLYESIEYRHLA